MRSGPVRLSDELARNGTIAQVSNRRCSLRWKGEPLDAWIAENMPPGYQHVLGYSATETRRIDRDRAITRHHRQPDYPLQRWGWTRETTRGFLQDKTGRMFARSCCSHCPFQASKPSRPEWAQRWRDHPAAAALGLRLEYGALALNPRMRLFGSTSARSLATDLGLDEALAYADRRLASARWALIDVRRVYTGTTAAMRSVRTLARGSRAQMQAALAACGPVTVDEYGIHRVWLRPVRDAIPRTEHLLVAAPGTVADKQRQAFEPLWDAVTMPADEVCGYGLAA